MFCISKQISNSDAIEATTNPVQIQRIYPDHIPEAFKKNLFWPTKTVMPLTNRKPREKIPAVTTSDQWKTYYQNKENEKIKKEELKKMRKDLREQKKKDREAAKVEKKARIALAREKRKRDLEQIKTIREEKKLKSAEKK